MFKSFFRNFFDSELKINLLLFLISILAYWEISLLQYSVQYDMLDVILPWRFHVGECLRHFYFPFWNPYQSAGYPIHADLQCPTWYPETIMIGSVFGYSNITLHILFTLYIFISGSGIFKLTKHFGSDNLPAFIAGAAFMLTGVFVSNAQHLFIIVSLAWMPWVILYYLKMSEARSGSRNVLVLSLFTFLLISGGYQAISIVMGYLLFILFIFYCIRALIKRDYHHLFRIVKVNLAWVLVTTGLCLVIIVSLRNVLEYVDRFTGMTLDQAMENPFTPRSLISLLVPFGVAKDPGFFGTDISMANLYMGIFMLGFFLTGLFIELKTELKILLVFGFIFLLASFGSYLSVREVLYKFFPLMDIFRLPGFLRVFIIIPVIVMGGMAIDATLKKPERTRRWIIPAFTIVAVALIIILIWSALKIAGNGFIFTDHSMVFMDKMKAASIYEHVLIHCIIQIILMVLFFILFRRKKRLKFIIPAFVLIEMLLAVQMNMMYTGCSPDFHPMAIRAEIKERPQGFPLPLPFNISGNTDGASAFEPLWRNVNIFNKSISFDAFTSFKLKGYKYLEDQAPLLKKAILQNQLLYLSDRLYNEDDHPPVSMKTFHPKDLFLSQADYIKLNKEPLRSQPGDTVFLTEFNPNEIRTFTKTKQPQVLTLLQSNYKGWGVLVDGEPVPHFTSNRLFISLLLPAGDHEVAFVFKNEIVKTAFIFSYLILLVIIVLLALGYLKEFYPNPFKVFLPAGIMILIMFSFALILNNLRQKQPARIYHKYAEMADEILRNNQAQTQCIFMVDDPAQLERIIGESVTEADYMVYNYCSPSVITQLWNDLSRVHTDNLFFASINVRLWPEVSYILNDLYPGIIKTDRTRISSIMQYTAGSPEPEESLFSTDNDFESLMEGWSGEKIFLDTTRSCSGRFSNRLDSLNSFSYTFSLPRSEITSKRKFIVNMSAAVLLPENLNAFFVLQIKRDDKTIGYFTRNIGDAVIERNVWRRVFFSKQIRNKLRPEDQINIYVWNNSTGKMWVDDLKVEVTLPY